MAQYDGEIVLNTKINSEGFKAGSKELEAAVRSVAGSIDGLGEKTRNSINKSVTAFAKQNSAYAEQKRKVDELKAKIAELSKQKVATSEWKEIQAQIDGAKSRINTLIDKQDQFLSGGGSAKSAVFIRRQSEIEQLKETINEAEKEQNELLSSGKAYQPVDTSQLQNELSAAENKLKLSGEGVQNSVDGISAKVDEAGKSAARSSSQMGSFGNAVKNVAAKTSQLVSTGLSRLGSGLKNIASKAMEGAKSLLHLGRSSNSSNGGLKVGLTTILKYAFGIRSLFKLVNKIRGAISEGVKAFASADAQTQSSINNLQVSLNNLKLSFASAFAPIINAVVPYLQILIGWLTTAINTLGKFFAALTGKSSYKVATTNSTSLTSATTKNTTATDKNTSSTKKATKATKDKAKATKKAKKENDKYLSGLDEMALFEKKSSSDKTPKSSKTPKAAKTPKASKVGGVGGAGAPKVKMAEVEIPKSIKNLADTIKKYIKQGDWKGLGKFIGLQLENALNSIPWSGIQAKVKTIVTNITDFLNGFFSNMGLATALGRTIAEYYNTGLTAAYTFLTGFDFSQFGEWLGTGINGAVANFDWELLGNTVAELINSAFDLVTSLVTTVDLGAIWDGLTTSITGFFDKLDITKNADLTPLKKAFDDVKNAAEPIVTGIKDGLKFMYDEVLTPLANWAVEEGLPSFLDTLASVFKTLSAVGGNVASALKSVWDNFLSPLAGFIGDAVTTFFSAVSDFFTKVSESQAAINVLTGVAIAIGVIVGVIKAWAIAQAILNAVMAVSPLTWIILAIVALIALIVGIIAYWDDIVAFVQGIWDKIVEVFGGIVDWFKNLFTQAWEGIKSAFASVGEFFSGIWEGIKSIFAAVGNWFKEKFEFAVAVVKFVWSKITGFFSGIWSGIKKVFSGIGSWFKKKFETALAVVKLVWSKVTGFFSGIWEGIKSIFSKVGGFFSGVFKGAINAIKKIWDGLVAIVKKPINLVIDGLNAFITGIKKAINFVIGAINKIQITPPKWFQKITGMKKFGFNIPKLSTKPPIPHLAKGAVIPPRSEYVAVLGDQKHGTNIETPENLLRQVVREESQGNGTVAGGGQYQFTAQINRRTLFDEVVEEAKLRKKQSGFNPLAEV